MHITGGVIFAQSSTIVTSKYNWYWHNSAVEGGAMYLTDTATGVIEFDDYWGNNATYGGAITVLGRSYIWGAINSHFSGNTAEWGGAVYINSVVLAGNPPLPPLRYRNSTWHGNVASQAGGAMFFAKGNTLCVNATDPYFVSNKAGIFGDIVGGYPQYASAVGTEVVANSGHVINSPPVSIVFRDGCGQLITGAGIVMTVEVGKGNYIASGASAAGNGMAVFTNLAITASPGEMCEPVGRISHQCLVIL